MSSGPAPATENGIGLDPESGQGVLIVDSLAETLAFNARELIRRSLAFLTIQPDAVAPCQSYSAMVLSASALPPPWTEK
jgi:hypothetical protein